MIHIPERKAAITHLPRKCRCGTGRSLTHLALSDDRDCGRDAGGISLQSLPCGHRPRQGAGDETGVGGSGRFSPGEGDSLAWQGGPSGEALGGVLWGDGTGSRSQGGAGLLRARAHSWLLC